MGQNLVSIVDKTNVETNVTQLTLKVLMPVISHVESVVFRLRHWRMKKKKKTLVLDRFYEAI
jgi:hypothetical protein